MNNNQQDHLEIMYIMKVLLVKDRLTQNSQETLLPLVIEHKIEETLKLMESTTEHK